MTSSNELRTRFLEFFERHDHTVVASSSLVPADDPTLLFTNAGMVQFKDSFLGREARGYVRATSSQRCVRAGGKHNDLENVGYTARHHTFFEMLGNFSFGDYFKPEAIRFAWSFLTEELGLPAERLWVTVFNEDDEAEKIWLEDLGVSRERFSRIGAKDNFWSMGETGPCGPCSEIFYDHGPDIPGGPPGSPDEDGDRYVEIWNLVFMQYNRAADGELTPLPKPSVDTGMGLERVAAILQGVHNNYDIDLFQRLIAATARELGCEDLTDNSLRVIADHLRSTAFLIVDGVLPSNEGRGYVLRRILRRAVRHGYKLGVSDPFFHRLVSVLVDEMGDAYPELRKSRAHVERVINEEEERFAETLTQGMKLLDSAISGLIDDRIPGDTVFRLYDTYGFPVDLTADIARERGLVIDMPGFETAMSEQRARGRAASRFGAADGDEIALDLDSQFTGYEQLEDSATVAALLRDGEPVDRLTAGESGLVVLDQTPFYAESGGQVGDCGRLRNDDVEFTVLDTQSSGGRAHAHVGDLVRGTIAVGDRLRAEVDHDARHATMRNHSATHLLHAALRDQLGDHVTQKGSLVEPGRLRFDFSHYSPMTADELAVVEDQVNQQIVANVAAEVSISSFDDAVANGAMALFGEKYGDEVRVLRFGDYSTELCGGTHCARTGDIGLFKITSETGIASGVRRIEAVTGLGAVHWVRHVDGTLTDIATRLKSGRDDIDGKIEQLLERNRQLEKQIQRLDGKLASDRGSSLVSEAIEIDGVKLVSVRMDEANGKQMRETVDQLKNKLGDAIIVLGAADGGKVRLIAGVTAETSARVPAGELINHVAGQVGGKGGGRADMAQAGGQDPSRLDEALASVETWVRDRLNRVDA